ncbi:MAG TPA: response regulator [Thermoanaerobaculia bacterium]|jgi:CheY-like chemotaxis protein
MIHVSAVLIVEDDSATRHLLEVLVRRNNCEPLLAADGRAALRHLETSDFDVILLDLFLPGDVDGWEVLRRLSLTTPHLLSRVVVITAASPVECKGFEPIASVWCTFHKPFELWAVEQQLRHCRAAKIAAGGASSAMLS